MQAHTVLVTGATGFIGSVLVPSLYRRKNVKLRVAARNASVRFKGQIETVDVPDIGDKTDWSKALLDTEVIIHLAGRAHVFRENASDPLAEFRRVNVSGTLELARQAAAKRVGRFIFISSVGVNGNETLSSAFTEVDGPDPREPYAISKWEAEEGLKGLAADTGMEVVIIRPPMVYGPNAPGNFGQLFRLVQHAVPTPLGAIRNRRSFIAVYNLVDFIITCIDHPAAANEVFLISDGEDLSTPELIRRMAYASGRSAVLIPVPVTLLRAGAAVLGKRAVAQRLLGSLQVDISKARRLLGWSPPVSVDEGLRRTVRYYSNKTDR